MRRLMLALLLTLLQRRARGTIGAVLDANGGDRFTASAAHRPARSDRVAKRGHNSIAVAAVVADPIRGLNHIGVPRLRRQDRQPGWPCPLPAVNVGRPIVDHDVTVNPRLVVSHNDRHSREKMSAPGNLVCPYLGHIAHTLGQHIAALYGPGMSLKRLATS